MHMKNADQVRYRKFAYYVKVNLPQVADVPAIVQAFQKYGQINRTTLKRALKWGQGPEIKITQLKEKLAQKSGHAGCFAINPFRRAAVRVRRVQWDVLQQRPWLRQGHRAEG